MTEQRVWLPFPPSTNNLFAQNRKTGRRFPSKGYKAWRNEAHVLLRMAKIPRFEVPVVIKLELTPKDNRARDASNYIKAVEDALVQARILIDDDQRYVKAVAPYWLNPSPRAGVLVIIRPAVNLGRGALTPAETRLLAAITHGMTVPAGHKPSNDLKGLLEKGYVKPVPGLLDGAVQGYAAED